MVSKQKRRADRLYQAGLYALAAHAYAQAPALSPDAVNDDIWLRAGIAYYKVVGRLAVLRSDGCRQNP